MGTREKILAGYSEATLYKHFDDKQEIFLCVIKERMPSFSSPLERVGTATVRTNVTAILEQLMQFYVLTFPIAASIFGSPELLAVQRDGMRGRNAGPEGPVHAMRAYLDREVGGGRLPIATDTEGTGKTSDRGSNAAGISSDVRRPRCRVRVRVRWPAH